MASSKKKTRIGLYDLPDEILVNILSLLPTKSAVATSLISRRWRYLWTSITNLQVDDEMFKEGSQFIKFMDRAMVLRNGSPLESFSLYCQVQEEDASSVNAWITSAIHQCNVEKLDLKIYDFTLRVPMSVSNLKCLSLYGVTFADDESTEKLLSSPLLQELTIKRCNWENVRTIRVSTPKLKVLDIVDEYAYIVDYDDDDDVNRKVCFIADNLWSFRYVGSLDNEYQICASSSYTQIKEAKIYVHPGIKYSNIMYVDRWYKLINDLSNTHSLTLTDCFLKALKHNVEQIDTIPVFECLTRLNLEFAKKAIRIDSTVLMKIFERSPHLERLDIEVLSGKIVRVPVLSPKPMCFRTHLKRIYIGNCVYHADKEDAIGVLLKSSAILEKMVINRMNVATACYGTLGMKELHNKLNRRPRDSKDCKIVLKHVNSFDDPAASWDPILYALWWCY